MSSGFGGSRVSIPNNVRKTIHDIREITGKQHSDDEIYAVLKECSMDPNETAQKLLYLDTFHEVKRRRDRRKENLNSKASEERTATNVHRRVGRGGGQGNYTSNFSSDAGGGRNAARRENGANHAADRGPMSSSLPFSQKIKNNATPRVTKASTGLPNGNTDLSNESISHGYAYASKLATGSEGHSLIDVNKSGPVAPQPIDASSSTFSSLRTEQGTPVAEQDQLPTPSSLPKSSFQSSDSLSAPSLLGHSGGVSMIENEVGGQQLAAEPYQINGEKTVSNSNVELGQPESEKTAHGDVNSTDKKKIPSKPNEFEMNSLSETSQPPPSSTHEATTPEVASTAVAISSQSTCKLNVFDTQHVTFPNHFQVPEALKNGLTFGSFDITFGPKVESVSDGVENLGLAESSPHSEETPEEPSSSYQNVSPNAQDDCLDNSQSLPQVLEKAQPSEGSVSSSTDKGDQSKQETQFPPDGHQIPAVINGPNYSLSMMPSMVGGQIVQLEGHEVQAHDNRAPNFANGNSLAPSSTNPVPPIPSSIAVSQQSVPVFRQTYPPNFFPYGQYISPFYMPPVHQFLSHNGFPPQPSSGNVYLPPPAAGVKFSLPQFKPGSNAGNPTHIGMQPAGSFITAPVGYAQPVSSASSVGNEDLVASHLKENQIYTTGQLTEGSAVWIHAAGQDMPSLQVNSLYNIPPQGHIAFTPPQSGHGAFAGMFPPGHAMTAAPTLLQQSQAVAGTIETIGPPSGAYQQPQHAQINWNTAAF
ncbi:GBF-interacting protein [Parasponia andersonii]|uniref:GBF-interacting protein n=1 Tax=Parasponia andersonii TaxID=3476 RepID=A0A2P5AUG0_PARAD|nr:GBF-interacting protein [Parasponia andersonii]